MKQLLQQQQQQQQQQRRQDCEKRSVEYFTGQFDKLVISHMTELN